MITKLAVLRVEGNSLEGVHHRFENMIREFGQNYHVRWEACKFQRNLFYPRDARGFCDNITETYTGFMVYDDPEDP